MRQGRLLLALALAALVALAYLGSRHSRPVLADAGRVDLSPEQEVALGPQSTARIAERLGGLDADEALARELAEVGGRLVTPSLSTATSSYGFRFLILADRQAANAFAAPDGTIFVTRGLLLRLATVDQVAGVLAHEIAHVLGRHSAEQLASGPPWAVLADGTPPAELDEALVNLAYGREDERAADALGIELMGEAGYDPAALAAALAELARNEGEPSAVVFARAHPDPGTRTASNAVAAGQSLGGA